MAEGLNQPSRVEEDGPMGCKLLWCGSKEATCGLLRVPQEQASANSVPAAAVIRRMRALSGIIGLKGCAGGPSSRRSKTGAQPRFAAGTEGLALSRCMRNASCSGEMHRYDAERRSRRQHASGIRTLRHESAGIEQD